MTRCQEFSFIIITPQSKMATVRLLGKHKLQHMQHKVNLMDMQSLLFTYFSTRRDTHLRPGIQHVISLAPYFFYISMHVRIRIYIARVTHFMSKPPCAIFQLCIFLHPCPQPHIRSLHLHSPSHTRHEEALLWNYLVRSTVWLYSSTQSVERQDTKEVEVDLVDSLISGCQDASFIQPPGLGKQSA